MTVSPDYAKTSIAQMLNQKAKEFYSNPVNVKAFKDWYKQKYGKEHEVII